MTDAKSPQRVSGATRGAGRRKRSARTKAKTGRPSAILGVDEKTLDDMFALVAGGCFAHEAASFIGVSPSTLRDWMARGRVGEEPFAGFVARMRQALATARIQASTAIFKDDKRFWLTHGPARHMPNRPDEPGWGTGPAAVELSGPGGGPIETVERGKVARMIDEMARRMAAQAEVERQRGGR